MKRSIFILMFLSLSASTASAAPRRLAVIVGSTSPVLGRAALRYSHADAKAVAAALGELGDFGEQDTRLLLDPRPEEVIAALDAMLSKADSTTDTLLFFYYSGHADDHALYPDGAPLPLSELQKRLLDPRAKVRIGVVDACRGGGWTGVKGLTPDAPFAIDPPVKVEAEGRVLIASSSGEQSAHEAEALGGSFFTHHFVAAIRGAADEDGDGRVALSEAFGYARRRTVRDAALYAKGDQSPSFAVDMSGRHDVLLTELSRAESRLVVEAHQDVLSIVDLESGAIIAELEPKDRAQPIAVRPGSYLVRAANEAHEVSLKAGDDIRVQRSDLHAHPLGALAEKAADSIPPVADRQAVGPLAVADPLLTISLLPDPNIGTTFYLKTLHSKGTLGPGLALVESTSYERLCTAPCEVKLAAGEYELGVKKSNDDTIVPIDPLHIAKAQKLRAVIDDGSGLRTAGYALSAVSLAAGGIFAVAAVTSARDAVGSTSAVSSEAEFSAASSYLAAAAGAVVVGTLVSAILVLSDTDSAKLQVE